MKTRIEFYVNTELIDVREWPLTPMADMLIELINSADDSSRIVMILRVMAVGDEDGFKYVVFCEDFKEWRRKQQEMLSGSGRTG